MADDGGVLSDVTPQPAPNPDALTTVNDFLDYTEYFPSDLVRSLRLIGDLDSAYLDATHLVHELTVKYGKLPTLPANARPDPTALRAEIAAALRKALHSRESSFAEATRLYEVAERHAHRIKIIKTKLKALPEPPSRDPTPAPVSPQATRPANRGFDRAPHLRLTFDAGRHGNSSTSRPRAHRRSLPGSRARDHSSPSSDSEVGSTIDLAITPRRLKINKDKHPKPPRVRVRAPGSGTNVHSAVAGISTSNALARLSPPPPDAKPGSRWAPWFKLTDYEMAVLRKKMKKNAVWLPSETMIKRQLELSHRGQEYYDKEKARCEATGEEMLDEEPVPASSKPKPAASSPVLERASSPPAATAPIPTTNHVEVDATPAPAPAPVPDSVPVSVPVSVPISVPVSVPISVPVSAPTATAAPTTVPVETPAEIVPEDTIAVEPATSTSSTDLKRETRRRQAVRDAKELQEATKKLIQAADDIQELDLSMLVVKSKTNTRSKRKREASPQPTASTPTLQTREPSVASQDSASKQPDTKRPRILPPLAPAPPPAVSSTPRTATPVAPSPVMNTPVPLPENVRSMTIQVPLAPAGPATPKATKPPGQTASRHATPNPPSPAITTPVETARSPIVPMLPVSNVTAASTRPRRESVAPKGATPPPSAPPAAKAPKSTTSTAEAALPTRPRSSRGHVPTPKAQSEEPKPLESQKTTRDLRRQSIFSQPALPGPTRVSSRKKPPPKGDITAGSEGQKSVTNVKRVQGNKNKKKKKADEDNEPADDIDPNEPRYCLCDDVSYGQMISCDNNCEKEWFHLGCVNMTTKDIPARRTKWYCPDCRITMNTDAYGNPLVPPPLPGRNRGNR
ncbi:unnamed protein product [Periconia digitata]|uniref:PHD-type domain-containing protein n=1 Tax=Periconia digitata TaxID=1303443 RepID=A0A9W4U919_9PLEO|nr:unnamed protein product [Periconia digitata]